VVADVAVDIIENGPIDPPVRRGLWQGAMTSNARPGGPVHDEIRYDVDDPVAVITLDRPASVAARPPQFGQLGS
jgi:hypothetical protein